MVEGSCLSMLPHAVSQIGGDSDIKFFFLFDYVEPPQFHSFVLLMQTLELERPL